MSKGSEKKGQKSTLDILAAKGRKEKLSVVTCYDSSFARLVNQTSIDMVLVGDSLGNVMLGMANTIPVTVDHMIHHTAAVSRVLNRAMLCTDMPFFSYHLSKSQALKNAGRMVQEGGAQGVKVEGGREICDKVAAIVKAGVPVIGHLGLTPQSIHALGGFRVQGRGKKAEQKLLDDAKALQDAGCFSIVLELLPSETAAKVTAALEIPTIGIGAGAGCDGQVLVMQDLLGMDQAFKPKFLKNYANLHEIVINALSTYDREVKDGTFPDSDHSFAE